MTDRAQVRRHLLDEAKTGHADELASTPIGAAVGRAGQGHRTASLGTANTMTAMAADMERRQDFNGQQVY